MKDLLGKKISIRLVLILVFFSLIYSSISLVNHYFFRTAILDLGIFNQAIHHYSKFSNNPITVYYSETSLNYLGDHFSPILILFAPFKYLFGSYTLLIIQILSISFGALGIRKIAKLKLKNHKYADLFLIHFLGIWAIYSALSFDFHTNVIAAMLVPWLYYYYEIGNKKMVMFYFILILASKENMPIWMMFILIGFILQSYKKGIKKLLVFEIPLLLITLIYFIIVTKVIIPFYNKENNSYQLFYYSQFGKNFSEIALYAITHPFEIFQLLYKSQLPEPAYADIKMEFHFMTLVSGGFALIMYPRFLIVLVPIYLQKMMANNHTFWGINAHYSIEITPIICIALIQFASKFEYAFFLKYILFATILSTYYYSYSTMESRKSIWYNKENEVFYDKMHYNSHLNVRAIHHGLENIPSNASVSSCTELAPHLADRDSIYYFPFIKAASYIVLLNDNSGHYPLSKEEIEQKVNELISSGSYFIFYNKNNLLILKKSNP
jgi:uncharacterized membrane protein